MTLRIERLVEDQTVVFHLSGQLESEHLSALETELAKADGKVALDLRDVTQVDIYAIRFLGQCQENGMELRRCAGYVRHWIQREQANEG